jgi:phosphatidylglycerol:prolipoprotein diacylglycerol transferase
MLPKLFEHGTFFLPTYGVLVALAFLVAIWVTGRVARRSGLNVEKVTNLAIYCAIAGMVGAKLFMFLFDWKMYAADPSEIFTMSTLQAAGVYQGGLILALITAFWYMRHASLPALKTADAFAPGVAIGHAIGRLGCFAAGCCWGQECHLPWAVTFQKLDAYQLTGVPLGIPLHPTQLYESFSELVIFVFLWWYLHRTHREGTVIGWYLILSSVARFFVEFVRNHEQALIAGLSLTQWISFVTFAAGIWLVMRPGARTVVATPRIPSQHG